jgi:hypothetical protein
MKNMDIDTNYTFETIYVFVSSLVVGNYERLLEATWGVRITISDIHAHLLKKVLDVRGVCLCCSIRWWQGLLRIRVVHLGKPLGHLCHIYV